MLRGDVEESCKAHPKLNQNEKLLNIFSASPNTKKFFDLSNHKYGLQA
jgi:hypothetical protein